MLMRNSTKSYQKLYSVQQLKFTYEFLNIGKRDKSLFIDYIFANCNFRY